MWKERLSNMNAEAGRWDGFPHLERHLIACALEGASLEAAVLSSSFSIQSCFGAAAGGGSDSKIMDSSKSHGLFILDTFTIPSKMELTKPWLDT